MVRIQWAVIGALFLCMTSCSKPAAEQEADQQQQLTVWEQGHGVRTQFNSGWGAFGKTREGQRMVCRINLRQNGNSVTGTFSQTMELSDPHLIVFNVAGNASGKTVELKPASIVRKLGDQSQLCPFASAKLELQKHSNISATLDEPSCNRTENIIFTPE